jgi:hypothetical protein
MCSGCRRKVELEAATEEQRTRLAALQEANRDAEAAARKLKRKAVQDVEAYIAEYDRDVAERHAEMEAEACMVDELSGQLAVRCSRSRLLQRQSTNVPRRDCCACSKVQHFTP